MKLLEGKTALVTGAARGIGKAIAIKFAEHGANIAFTDLVKDENMEKVENELQKFNIKAKGYSSDASSFEITEKTINQIIEDFSTIHIVVNNAGITRDNLLMRMTEDQWDLVMNVNLKSVFNVTKSVLRVLMKQKEGSIINMGSVVGISGNAGQSNYSASKAGIFGFTKSIAQEIGSRNIRVNAIAPGFIETDMTHGLDRDKIAENIPLKRLGQVSDIAKTVRFLATDGKYITSQVISVDGGLTI